MAKKSIFVSLFIFFLVVSTSFAQTVLIKKPEWPQDFESWPHKFSGSAEIDQKNRLDVKIFAKTNTENKSVEIIMTIGINEEMFYISHRFGSPVLADNFVTGYLLIPDYGWLRYNLNQVNDAVTLLFNQILQDEFDIENYDAVFKNEKTKDLNRKVQGFFSDLYLTIWPEKPTP